MNTFAGIPFGSMTNNYKERVVKNAMVIDVLGNVAVLADLQPVNMAAIQAESNSHGVLLAISEGRQQLAIIDGHRVELEFSPTIHPKVATAEQNDTLAGLAARELDDDRPIADKLARTSKRILPALWYSDIAFDQRGLHFREGAFHTHYTSALDYISQTVADMHTQSHREFNAAIRSHLSDLGFDMRQVPMPELDEQRRQRELDEIDPSYSGMLARAQELQLYNTDLHTEQFVTNVARAYVAHTAS